MKDKMAQENQKDFNRKYENLKCKIIKNVQTCSNDSNYKDSIYQLKCKFKKYIRSVRQLDEAKTIERMIHLLEKRLHLGWFNVDIFGIILQEFNISGSTFIDYTNYRDDFYKYKSYHTEEFLLPPYDPDIFREIPDHQEVIPAKIADHICSKMGFDWDAFGRELVDDGVIIEKQLDNLSKTDAPSEVKTSQLLELFVKGDKRSLRGKLLKLLKSIHRNDLEEEVNTMFLDNKF